MFKFSKMNPVINLNSDSYHNLGDNILEAGNRVLLICSGNNKERGSLDQIKELLSQNNITFIQYNQLRSNLNYDNLNQIIQRAKDFGVGSIVSIGDFEQIMAGRYISDIINLPYYELTTNFFIPFLLFPQSIYSNRVGDGHDSYFISPERVKEIYCDQSLKQDLEELDIILTLLSMLLVLSQLFLESENNLISVTESRNLFNRILDILESGNYDSEDLYIKGLTTNLYHQISNNTNLHLTLFSWVAAYRFKLNPYMFSAKILPWYLESYDETELNDRVKTILIQNNLYGRLVELGFTLEQLLSITEDNSETASIIDKAF